MTTGGVDSWVAGDTVHPRRAGLGSPSGFVYDYPAGGSPLLPDSPERVLAEVVSLLDRHHAQKAMLSLERLIGDLGPERLQLLSPDLRRLIDRFHHKKRRDLHSRLDARLGTPIPADAAATTSLESIRADYRPRLDALREKHIFQWSTHYRATIGYILKDLLRRIQLADSPDRLLLLASAEFQRHSLDIYTQGFRHITGQLANSESVAHSKSINGLQRFLLLLVQEHTMLARNVRHSTDSRALRNACSALLTGILLGYADLSLGTHTGWALLQSRMPLWAHTLAFLRGSDLERLLELPNSNTASSTALETILLPVLLALDRFFDKRQGDDFLLTRVSRFSTNPLRLEFSLALPARASRQHLTILCYLDGPHGDHLLVTEPVSAGVTLICLHMTPELRASSEGLFDGHVLDATKVGSEAEHIHSLSNLSLSILERRFTETLDNPEDSLRRVHNYAREFPLEDPVLRRFFLVERHSVKRLLELFEHGTGAHVWCSVRRSGKTTAAVDLAGSSGRSTVTIQTMDQQPHAPELNIFYEEVTRVLHAGRTLSKSFLSDVVRTCATAASPVNANAPKHALVIDEYESLFGHLDAAVRADSALRYSVVQPLLSQMVAFSIDNILIFLGQRPDAHYILMSQNQLSPLVQQDAFPLFEHQAKGTDTEFAKLLSLVLSEKIPFGPSFTDAVYAVTAGHPYLTVNLLVDFCQWLIENNVRAGAVRLTETDFGNFSRDRLTATALRNSTHYGFFQKMLAEYLSELAREREPWLYAVASVLYRLCRNHPRALATSVPKYKEMAKDVASLASLTPEQLLSAASRANFLAVDGGQVRPAIPLMGRLAAVAVPELN